MQEGLPPQATGEPSPVGAACPEGLGGFPNLGNWRKRKACRRHTRSVSGGLTRRASRLYIVFLIKVLVLCEPYWELVL